jgi:addiction module HigA family antidote
MKMIRIGMRPIHPGEILSEEFLKPLGIITAALASSLNVPVAEVSDVVRRQSGVSGGLAKKLYMHLKTTPEFWLSLQSTYDLRTFQIERG